MKTQTFKNQEYSDRELENQLDAQHQEILQNARVKGEHFGRQNRPDSNDQNLWGYISDFFPKYQQMLLTAKQKIQPDTANADARMVTVVAEEKAKVLSEKQRVVQTEIAIMELDFKRRGINLDDIPVLKVDKKFYIILLIIIITEIAFNTTAFQLVGENFLISLIISTGVTFALLLLVKELALNLKENTNRNRIKALAFAGGVLIVLAVFYFLAQMRTEAVVAQTDAHIPPIAFVALNLLFIIPAFIHFYRNAIRISEKQRIGELMKLKEQMDELKRQDEQYTQEIEQIKQETAKEVNRLLHKPAYVKLLTERIFAWQAEAVEEFKSFNLTARSDRKIPNSFYQPIKPPFHPVN